jgi:hypothetical protein
MLRGGAPGGGILPTVSHPSLGLPPRSLRAGFPDAAARLRADRAGLAARSLEVAADADPTLAVRHDEAGLRNLLRDAEVLVDRLALCVAGDDAHWLKEFAEHSATVFRRRGVQMDDVIGLCEGIRTSARGILNDEEMAPATAGLDAAVAVLSWHRRISGDGHERNRLSETLYKGI